MNRKKIVVPLLIVLLALVSQTLFASAYNDNPQIVVLVVVDQLRQDLLERYHDQLTANGFRRFSDRGAWFASCYYQYANTRTAPGHASLGTGTYTLGHGIVANEWFDPAWYQDPRNPQTDPLKKGLVSSVFDPGVQVVGAPGKGAGSSPHNLLTDTFGDELKLATQGRARVYGVALKDRAAILPVGWSADAAFWTEQDSGAWISSTFYHHIPEWLAAYNQQNPQQPYLGREWKDKAGKVLRTTTQPANGKPAAFYDLVGPTPFGNDYTFDFARTLIERERLGKNQVTDLLVISLSSHDILGHKTGPDSPEEEQMILDTDRSLNAFFNWLDRRFGPGNMLLALSADHGIAPLPTVAASLHIPAANLKAADIFAKLNRALAEQLGKPGNYIARVDYPNVYLNQFAWFESAGFKDTTADEARAEQLAGEAMSNLGLRGYITKTQLAEGKVPNTVFARKYLNSYSPLGGWYVMGISAPFLVGSAGTDHAQPYSYDSHVPCAFAGTMIRPGIYRQASEPIDLAVTINSILGINPPASAVGRVLYEAIEPGRQEVVPQPPAIKN